jgi:hypothetical protein
MEKTAKELRALAARYHQLAAQIGDPQAARALTNLADDYRLQADAQAEVDRSRALALSGPKPLII